MPEKLFIRLYPSAQHVNWLVLNQQGELAGQPYFGSLEEAAPLAAGRQVVVIVPGSNISMANAQMPTKNRQRMMQAIPYVLEDQVAEDVIDMHFALGRQVGNNQVSVAMVGKEQMQHWLQAMEEAGIKPYAVVPDTLSVPLVNGHWGVLLDGDKAIVRTGDQIGFVTERDNLSLILPRVVKEAEIGPDGLEVIDCGMGDPPSVDSFGIEADVTIDRCDQGALLVLARNYNPDVSINLLQGEYSRREQLGKKWKPWLPAAVMAGLFLVVQVFGTAYEYYTLSQRKAAINDQIVAIFKQTFPGKTATDKNALSRMRIELRQLQAGGGQGSIGFLEMLSELGPHLSKTQDLKLQRFHYKDGRLDLDLQLPSVQQLDQLMGQLNTLKQFTLDQPTVSNKGEIVNVRLKIKQAT